MEGNSVDFVPTVDEQDMEGSRMTGQLIAVLYSVV
jgi:hypothetical protein